MITHGGLRIVGETNNIRRTAHHHQGEHIESLLLRENSQMFLGQQAVNAHFVF
jgi:hypothetical protein